jgi:hypothetical protein
MLLSQKLVLLAACFLSLGFVFGDGGPKAPTWVGKGEYRLLVRVDPLDLGARNSDEMPARVEMSAQDMAAKTGAQARIDVASIQVERYDPETGEPFRYGKWAYAQEPWEVPFRWYDASIPEEFPEFAGNVDRTNGELRYANFHNWGYFYETLGEWKSGHLGWIHTQEGRRPSYYAIYFDMLPKGQEPDTVPRRGFLGDGMERITEPGPTTHGLRRSRIVLADWNGDGLPDILVGGERGGMVWFPNRGTKTHPNFAYAKLVFMADGRPLDVGFSSSPLVVDWDGDGVQDLLCGAEWNRVIWYKNVGTNADPKLVYKGFIRADGEPLQLPHEPNPEIPGIYKTDYHPVLAVADLEGKGEFDLFAGGYVTGRIYWFENLGRDRDNLPSLKFRGPLEADGEPIDTQWGAAPEFADFDADGDLDLISGSFAMTPGGGDSCSSENYLYYFENIGTAKRPRFTRRPFPVKGKFHCGALATPRAADLHGDGLLDLVVSEGPNIYIFRNVGTRTSRLWEYDAHPLTGHWNTAPVWGQPSDWNRDGYFDLVNGFTVQLNQGKGNPQLFGPPESILPPGEQIFHKSPRGDQWTYTQVVDMDSDGRPDILYGVHEGNIYLHRNLSSNGQARFDTAGVLLKTVDDKPIKVGPLPGHPWDFEVLQGARTTLTAADFDRDGKIDLAVGDTYGKVRYYRNLTGGPNPRFGLPVVIADAGRRLVPTTADWNGDGWPDVLVGTAGGPVLLILNTGKSTGPQFLPPRTLDVPPLPFGSTVMAFDWNGDGDLDLLALASYGYLCWFDRSFLEHGYALAKLERIEVRGQGK